MDKVTVTVDNRQPRQTMQGFGASGAWWAQEVGGWDHTDPDSGKAVRESISELLHSKEHGIGLDIYRYNIGGGSKNSGKGDFWNPLRRAETFEIDAGQYDRSRDANAVYMMKQAVKDGAGEVVLFCNSPPERLTINGKSHLDKNFRPNIKKHDCPAFGRYVADIAEHFVGEGVPVKYVSPVNEPQWKWTGGQEGCHYRPWGVRWVLRATAEELEKRPALRGVKLAGPENGDIRFFNKTYIRWILRDKVIRRNLDAVDVHSYFTILKVPLIAKPLNDRRAFLRRFGRWMARKHPDIPVKMSEWCHMKGGRDKGMDSALEMAKIMVEDLSLMNAVSWQHWIAVSEVDFCDGLIYINLENKTYETTKRYYATGNFSLYIKPGAQRYEVNANHDKLLLLAFKHHGEITVIAVNPTREELVCDFGKGQAAVTVTDDKQSLARREVPDASCIVLTPRSVNTVVRRE